MTRFEIVEEKTKDGRKTEVQFAIRDKFINKVVIRYATLLKADFMCAQMNEVADRLDVNPLD